MIINRKKYDKSSCFITDQTDKHSDCDAQRIYVLSEYNGKLVLAASLYLFCEKLDDTLYSVDCRLILRSEIHKTNCRGTHLLAESEVYFKEGIFGCESFPNTDVFAYGDEWSLYDNRYTAKILALYAALDKMGLATSISEVSFRNMNSLKYALKTLLKQFDLDIAMIIAD